MMMYGTPPSMGGMSKTISPNAQGQQMTAAMVQQLQFKPFKAPDGEFDGKRLRKSVMRKTVDYNCSIVKMLESRIWQRDERDRPALTPDICYASHILPPPAYPTNPINAVVTKFVRTSTNKAKCPIFCLAWTPEGRRLVTGASSGEFTLWNGLTFNFETILQAHESSVRTMVWSHNDQWMVTGDTSGYIKYWQSNMNNVKCFQAHHDPVRGLSFSPSDQKFATGSDDGTVRIWDFFRCQEERVLRGHGADVKCVDWHPSKSLLASGSKDNQQPIKLWDPRTGQALAKLHAHKSTVMDLKWNSNGNWLCSASRDHLLKLFDVRNFSTELQIFRGHKKEASSISWHPQHEFLFASGGSDGSILFWHVGNDKEVGMIESAHDGIIWDLAWHPLGHILCSGSNDHTSKFWTRNRLGDKMRDRYNLNTIPAGVLVDDSIDIDDIPVMANMPIQPTSAIPGMGPDDKIEEEEQSNGPETIPGLELDGFGNFERFSKKTPYAKPIPKTFQAAWNSAGDLEDIIEDENPVTSWVVINSASLFCYAADTDGDLVFTSDGNELPAGSIPLKDVDACAISYLGFYIPLTTPVSGDKIKDAFDNGDDEEALAAVTSDQEFARRLIKEHQQLFGNNHLNLKDEDKKPPIKKQPLVLTSPYDDANIKPPTILSQPKMMSASTSSISSGTSTPAAATTVPKTEPKFQPSNQSNFGSSNQGNFRGASEGGFNSSGGFRGGSNRSFRGNNHGGNFRGDFQGGFRGGHFQGGNFNNRGGDHQGSPETKYQPNKMFKSEGKRDNSDDYEASNKRTFKEELPGRYGEDDSNSGFRENRGRGRGRWRGNSNYHNERGGFNQSNRGGYHHSDHGGYHHSDHGGYGNNQSDGGNQGDHRGFSRSDRGGGYNHGERNYNDRSGGGGGYVKKEREEHNQWHGQGHRDRGDQWNNDGDKQRGGRRGRGHYSSNDHGDGRRGGRGGSRGEWNRGRGRYHREDRYNRDEEEDGGYHRYKGRNNYEDKKPWEYKREIKEESMDWSDYQ